MDIFGFDAATFLSFLLTLMRVSIVVFLLPFFGGETIPAMIKASVCLVLTLALWPTVALPGSAMPPHPFGILLMILSEVIMGFSLGLCVHFIFAALQTGGEVLAFQMGFTMVSFADPVSGAQVSIPAHLLYMVAMLVFLIFDGHLHLLDALGDSFRLVPAGGFTIKAGPMTDTVLALSGGLFSLALKIAAPVMAALFMIELALALMGRAAPQMNLMTLGFPIKISVGFFFMSILFTILSGRMEDFIIEMRPFFDNLLRMGAAN